MTCEHAETTVLLYLFGEAPDGFEEHLADCDDCQESLAEHAATVRAVEPVLGPGGATAESPPSLEPRSLAPAAAGPRGGAADAAPEPRPVPGVMAAAAAAALALVVARWPSPQGVAGDQDGTADAVTPMPDTAEPWVDPIERELEDLSGEFDSLFRDLEEP